MPGCCFQLPPTTVAGVAEQLAQAMHIDGIRIIGDPDMEVERAVVVFHFLGGDMDKESLKFTKENHMQVVIPGEVVDWTIGEYVQDGLFFGQKLALLNPGHFNWEEPGMEYMAQWLAEDLGGAMPPQISVSTCKPVKNPASAPCPLPRVFTTCSWVTCPFSTSKILNWLVRPKC